MRINAIIASAILAVTVSGAALPLPAAAAVPATIGQREAAPVAAWKPPKRPYGLPVGGKREAAPEADAPWRPYGLPIGGKHEADEE